VDAHTISNFERERRRSYPITVHSLADALEAAGVEFTNGNEPGVKMKARTQ